jgi:hypothetical protein
MRLRGPTPSRRPEARRGERAVRRAAGPADWTREDLRARGLRSGQIAPTPPDLRLLELAQVRPSSRP